VAPALNQVLVDGIAGLVAGDVDGSRRICFGQLAPMRERRAGRAAAELEELAL